MPLISNFLGVVIKSTALSLNSIKYSKLYSMQFIISNNFVIIQSHMLYMNKKYICGSEHHQVDSTTFDILSYKMYAVIKIISVTTTSNDACAVS